jgi:hypothetical protein
MYNSKMRSPSRHKVFISFHHNDEYYKNKFEELFGHIFLNKSVGKDEINIDVSTEYIKRLIQEDYISDCSVAIVLVGQRTYCRKHVDWEISATLSARVGGYSGLIGVLLPEYPLTLDGKYHYENIPLRLADNIKSGYAKMYLWSRLCSGEDNVRLAIEDAYNRKNIEYHRIDNSRLQIQLNRCE